MSIFSIDLSWRGQEDFFHVRLGDLGKDRILK